MEGTSIPVRRSRARTQAVTNRIRQQILSGVWADGRLLPSERELAHQFSVARNTLRRILRRLEAEGLLESQAGRGSVVRLSPLGDQMSRADPIALPAVNASQADLLEMRALLEPLVAELAAARAMPEEILGLEAAHQNAVEAKEPAALEHWIAEFHRAVWRATGNVALLAWYDTVDQQLPPRAVPVEARGSYLKTLAALLAALRSRDADLARDVMADLMRRRDAARSREAVHA
jgi:GntR family transcriptional repressor for pyruvate dehydrogenase complex